MLKGKVRDFTVLSAVDASEPQNTKQGSNRFLGGYLPP